MEGNRRALALLPQWDGNGFGGPVHSLPGADPADGTIHACGEGRPDHLPLWTEAPTWHFPSPPRPAVGPES